MKTWHELVQIEAQFYPAGAVGETFNPVADAWWFENGKTNLAEVSIGDFRKGRIARIECAAIRFTIIPIAAPAWVEDVGMSWLETNRDDVEWELYRDLLAGIAMSKRLNHPQQSMFHFLTYWSITEDVRRDQDGLAESECVVELEGELNVEWLRVNYYDMLGFGILGHVQEFDALHAPNEEHIAGIMGFDFMDNKFNTSLILIRDKGMLSLGDDFPRTITLTERGRAYLRGEVEAR